MKALQKTSYHAHAGDIECCVAALCIPFVIATFPSKYALHFQHACHAQISILLHLFKNDTCGSTRLAADGISYRQLAGTREYERIKFASTELVFTNQAFFFVSLPAARHLLIIF
jgi:hypothetical protein